MIPPIGRGRKPLGIGGFGMKLKRPPTEAAFARREDEGPATTSRPLLRLATFEIPVDVRVEGYHR
jgi:hypothetical protein